MRLNCHGKDRRIIRLSIFDGIPSGWKDVIDIKNYPAFGGSKLLKKLRKNIKVKDANIVTNARRSGIIPLFKTSTVEFAFGGLGLNSSQQYPKNQMYKDLRCSRRIKQWFSRNCFFKPYTNSYWY